MWCRSAPSVSRTPTSRPRTIAAASIRLARFAHAINRSSAAAPCNSRSPGRTAAASSSPRRTRRPREPLRGCSFPRANTASSLAVAAAVLTYGASLPNTAISSCLVPSVCGPAALDTKGTHALRVTRPPAQGGAKVAGITPATVQGSRSSRMTRPMTSGAKANWDAQRSYEITVVRPPGLKSLDASTRPVIAATPNREKKSGVTRITIMTSASPLPLAPEIE